jgi:hypothetical protein
MINLKPKKFIEENKQNTKTGLSQQALVSQLVGNRLPQPINQQMPTAQPVN